MVICFLFLIVYANIIGGSSTLEMRLNWGTHARELSRGAFFETVNQSLASQDFSPGPKTLNLGEKHGDFIPETVSLAIKPFDDVDVYFVLGQGMYGEKGKQMGMLYGGYATKMKYSDGKTEVYLGRFHGIDKAWFRYFLEDSTLSRWFEVPGSIKNPASVAAIKSKLNKARMFHDNLSKDIPNFTAAAEVSASLFFLERISRMLITKHQYTNWFKSISTQTLAQELAPVSESSPKKVTPEVIDSLIPSQFKAAETNRGLEDVLKAGGTEMSARFMSTFGEGEGAKILLAEIYEVLHRMDGSVPIESEKQYLKKIRGRPQFKGCKDVPIIGEVCKDVKEYIESKGQPYDEFLYEKVNELLGSKGLPVPGTPGSVETLRQKMEENANQSASGMATDAQIKSALNALLYFLRIFRPEFNLTQGKVKITEYFLADGLLPVLGMLMPEISLKDMLSDEMVPCDDLVKLLVEGAGLQIQSFQAEGATITFKGCQ